MKKRHQPYHIYENNALYFVSAHVYKNNYRLASDEEKQKLILKIHENISNFCFQIYAWVVLEDHYHLLIKTSNGINLPKFIGRIHAGFSYEINKLHNKRGRKIWQNYWDRCIRTEFDFWTHFNYIHHNPVKHSFTEFMKDYSFSSFNHWTKKKGLDWIMSVFERYPVVDFSVSGFE